MSDPPDPSSRRDHHDSPTVDNPSKSAVTLPRHGGNVNAVPLADSRKWPASHLKALPSATTSNTSSPAFLSSISRHSSSNDPRTSSSSSIGYVGTETDAEGTMTTGTTDQGFEGIVTPRTSFSAGVGGPKPKGREDFGKLVNHFQSSALESLDSSKEDGPDAVESSDRRVCLEQAPSKAVDQPAQPAATQTSTQQGVQTRLVQRANEPSSEQGENVTASCDRAQHLTASNISQLPEQLKVGMDPTTKKRLGLERTASWASQSGSGGLAASTSLRNPHSSVGTSHAATSLPDRDTASPRSTMKRAGRSALPPRLSLLADSLNTLAGQPDDPITASSSGLHRSRSHLVVSNAALSPSSPLHPHPYKMVQPPPSTSLLKKRGRMSSALKLDPALLFTSTSTPGYFDIPRPPEGGSDKTSTLGSSSSPSNTTATTTATCAAKKSNSSNARSSTVVSPGMSLLRAKVPRGLAQTCPPSPRVTTTTTTTTQESLMTSSTMFGQVTGSHSAASTGNNTTAAAMEDEYMSNMDQWMMGIASPAASAPAIDYFHACHSTPSPSISRSSSDRFRRRLEKRSSHLKSPRAPSSPFSNLSVHSDKGDGNIWVDGCLVKSRDGLQCATTKEAYTLSVQLLHQVYSTSLYVSKSHNLNISGETTSFEEFNRVVTFPLTADMDKLSATLKDGLVRVTVPRLAQAPPQPHKFSLSGFMA